MRTGRREEREPASSHAAAGGAGWGAPGRAARHGAAHGAAPQRGQHGGKQTGRKRTFPGVRFSWKGARLELTSHGTKEQRRLKNRLKNLFDSRPALHVMELQDGCVLFCSGCFYVVLLARQPVLPSEEALTPIPGYIPTHPLAQGPVQTGSITPPQPSSLHGQKQAHEGNLKQTGPNTSSGEPGSRVPLAWDAETCFQPRSTDVQLDTSPTDL